MGIAQGDDLMNEIARRMYHPEEVQSMLNEAYFDGLQARHVINIHTHRLARLIRDILRTAAISPTSRLIEHLLELAEYEAGEADLTHLAGEVIKRYDILNSDFTKSVGVPLTTYDQSIKSDASTVREAVLHLSRGDSRMILSQDVLDIADHVIRWKTPDAGRPAGMSESTHWFAERLLHHRKQYRRGWWRAALALFRELAETPASQWRGGHKQAYETLKMYISADESRVDDKASLNKYCSNLIKRYNADRKKN